jgi:hypothetical protein
MKKTKQAYPLKYTGNIIILILCLLIFFPVALVLLFKNLRVLRDKNYQYLEYHGSYGWLIFWTIFLFPIALILLLINGADLVEERI